MDAETTMAPLIAVMKPMLVVGIILLIFKVGINALVTLIKKSRKQKKQNSPSYERQRFLLTPGELKFYRALKVAVGNDYQIMCQVNLSQIIQTRPMNPSERQTAFNKISRKVLDFVLCDSRNLAIIAAIELDDSSHNRKDRIDRDKFLNEAMEDAGVPLIRFQARSSYTADQITQKITSLKQKDAA